MLWLHWNSFKDPFIQRTESRRNTLIDGMKGSRKTTNKAIHTEEENSEDDFSVIDAMRMTELDGNRERFSSSNI